MTDVTPVVEPGSNIVRLINEPCPGDGERRERWARLARAENILATFALDFPRKSRDIRVTFTLRGWDIET